MDHLTFFLSLLFYVSLYSIVSRISEGLHTSYDTTVIAYTVKKQPYFVKLQLLLFNIIWGILECHILR